METLSSEQLMDLLRRLWWASADVHGGMAKLVGQVADCDVWISLERVDGYREWVDAMDEVGALLPEERPL